jgi:hypothetical protein
MSKSWSLITVMSCAMLFACESRFPVEKRFWTPDDYEEVWNELNYNTPKGEEYPRFSNPETAEVVRKIVDPRNYEAILEDSELGLNYRSEVSQEFFEHIKYIMDLYGGMDVQDKFIYAEELAEMRTFFLGFQIVYFRLGNENIASQSDDRNTIRRNEQTIIGNFNSYLEGLRRERAYGPYAANLGEGMTTHFTKLIETFPNANYKGMLSTAKAMQGKVETPEIEKALSGLIGKLESIQSKDADPV